jgi:hypothetical protein
VGTNPDPDHITLIKSHFFLSGFCLPYRLFEERAVGGAVVTRQVGVLLGLGFKKKKILFWEKKLGF